MNNPRTEVEWEELFQQHLPDIPLPPAVARHTRAMVRLEISQMTGQRTPSNVLVHEWIIQWWERLVSALQPSRSRTMLMSSAALAAVVIISIALLGNTRVAHAATVRLSGGTAIIVDARTGISRTLSGGSVTEMEPGDTIATQTGTAVITYFEGQTTIVQPGSRVQLLALNEDRGATHVEVAVWAGQTTTQFGKPLGPEDQFQVKSPSSSAQVQDAQGAIIVDVRSERETRYVADTGKAVVVMGNQTTDVKAGQEVVAAVGQDLHAEPVAVAASPTNVPPQLPAVIVPPTIILPRPEASSTPIALPTSTNTPVPTEVPIASTTPVVHPTSIPQPTAIPTEPPTPTATQVPVPTDTPIPVPTDKPVPQPTNTPAPAPSDTPIPVPTDTPAPVPTDTPVPLPTDTPIPVPTDTPAPVPTDTPLPSPTNSPIPVPTDTPAPVPTDTPIPAPTNTPVPVPTDTPAVNATITPIASVTDTPLPVATSTPTSPQNTDPTPSPQFTPLPIATNALPPAPLANNTPGSAETSSIAQETKPQDTIPQAANPQDANTTETSSEPSTPVAANTPLPMPMNTNMAAAPVVVMTPVPHPVPVVQDLNEPSLSSPVTTPAPGNSN